MIKTTPICWSNIHENGSLWIDHMKIRKQLFVDSKNWHVPHNEEIEWDQYDTGNTIYAITHDNGKVLAASRLNPCDFESDIGSYMIKDATRGLLAGIPSDILEKTKAPVDEKVLEATRFTVDPSLSPEEKNEAMTRNATDLAAIAAKEGAHKLIALMPPAFIRILTNMGLPTKRVGPIKIDANGGKCCVMEMAL